jgi:hypothetical protein
MASSWFVLRTNGRRGVPMALLVLALVTGMAVVASVSCGEYRVPPLAVVKPLLGLETGDPSRLPRAAPGEGDENSKV